MYPSHSHRKFITPQEVEPIPPISKDLARGILTHLMMQLKAQSQCLPLHHKPPVGHVKHDSYAHQPRGHLISSKGQRAGAPDPWRWSVNVSEIQVWYCVGWRTSTSILVAVWITFPSIVKYYPSYNGHIIHMWAAQAAAQTGCWANRHRWDCFYLLNNVRWIAAPRLNRLCNYVRTVLFSILNTVQEMFSRGSLGAVVAQQFFLNARKELKFGELEHGP